MFMYPIPYTIFIFIFIFRISCNKQTQDMAATYHELQGTQAHVEFGDRDISPVQICPSLFLCVHIVHICMHVCTYTHTCMHVCTYTHTQT